MKTPLELDAFSFLQKDAAVQRQVVAFVARISAASGPACASVPAAAAALQALAAGELAAAGSGGFPRPACVHPPLPHDMPCADAPASPVATDVVTLHVPLTIDAFDLLNHSPALGQELLLRPGTSFQEAMDGGLRLWLLEALEGALTAPPVLLPLLREQRLLLRVTLLVIRIPHFYAAESFLLHEDAPSPDEPDAAAADRRSDGSLSLSPIRAVSAHRSLSCAGAATPSRDGAGRSTRLSFPTAAHVEDARVVTIVGIVHEIFFAARNDNDAAPWVVLLLLPANTVEARALQGTRRKSRVPGVAGPRCAQACAVHRQRARDPRAGDGVAAVCHVYHGQRGRRRR
ncbi:hypothetical protein STCU_11872 [Strigomonas culicis]|uniref:Uncharacterized protein n=1 Tax=Strigomonas culicis TaxID=28005 RepID=S9ULU6_9TRYP|nr:hypothetical protein STCU_11872 [Strigomonas culicis]|eukprot:EPY15636.1 hypothetical protein STCU_11872 [Strigomonas culicis]